MENVVLQGMMRFFRRLLSTKAWQRFWTKDWVLKFVSLLLATVLWYFVGGENTVDKTVTVPIEIINLPRDLVISNQFKKDIDVTVSGPRSLIQDITNKAVTRQINLAKATPGTNVIQNDNNSIQVPRGVTVLRIQPSSIILSLDKLIKKQFPVKPVTVGHVPEGYVLEKLKMEPDTITITGPETTLTQVAAFHTDKIDLSGMKESKQLQVPLVLEPAIVELIGETSVTASIVIKPKMVQKKINRLTVHAMVDGAVRKVVPAAVDVIANIPELLEGEHADLASLFEVSAQGKTGDSSLTVKVVPEKSLKLPVEIVSVIPDSVKVVKAPVPHKSEGRHEGATAPETGVSPTKTGQSPGESAKKKEAGQERGAAQGRPGGSLGQGNPVEVIIPGKRKIRMKQQ